MTCLRAPFGFLKFALLFAVAACLTLISPERAGSAPGGEADRGLDFLLHTHPTVKAGGVLELDVMALGFPTARKTVALPGATIEATWDPESLLVGGKDDAPAIAPPTVKATSDEDGRATLALPVPDGYGGNIKLLVSVRAQGKERVREFDVSRVGGSSVQLFVSDSQVVPGSEVVAWALFTADGGAKPVAKSPIEFRLTQGRLTRFSRVVTTDDAGSAMVRMPIPRDREPDLRWELEARAVRVDPHASGSPPSSRLALTPREETPGAPSLTAQFDESTVPAGQSTILKIRLRDASEQGVMSHPIFVWTGPRGTEAPKDDKDFRAVAKRLTTDGGGEASLVVQMPSTVALRGTTMQTVIRTEFEGQAMTETASASVTRKLSVVSLLPESGALVPGLEQRVFFSLSDDEGEPAKGVSLKLKGDGLDTTVATNDGGEALFTWKVPAGIGAHRDVGPCPGNVAAAVTVTPVGDAGKLAAIAGPLCIDVDRSRTTLLRAKVTTVRAGEPLTLELLGGNLSRASFLLKADNDAAGIARWAPRGQNKLEVVIPETMRGVVRVSAALPQDGKAAAIASTSVLVLPKTIASVKGKVSGGRAAPGGTVSLSAQLTDEQKKPLQGSIAAVVIDKYGGGSFGALYNLDTQRSLCSEVHASQDECKPVLSSDAGSDILRGRLLTQVTQAPSAPQQDPNSDITTKVEATFRSVVRSLEGAVFQSSMTQETQADARRSKNGVHSFNPELMTLVTEAMDQAPEMPGGETITLGDLMAIDRQITFDNVARRVTRLKLFRVLAAIRQFRHAENLDPGEPLLKDPNVLLRKLVREGTVAEGLMLDPWGGKLGFVKSGIEVTPFLTVTKGFALQAPGPDGKLGTGDDVKSPFERVLNSKTPYAEAVSEDVVVDALFDMRVSDATVDAWETTLESATGTMLGDSFGAGGLGLSGVGSGGGGFGSGHGRLGGASRRSFGVAKGIAFVSPAVRTDEQGIAKIDIVLPDTETTWTVAFIAIPDHARPAMDYLDIPVTVPLSAKVDLGSMWTVGDSSEARVALRNRTEKDLTVNVRAVASASLSLGKGENGVRSLVVPKQGGVTLRLPLLATKAGAGSLAVEVAADGVPSDKLTHEISVDLAGEEYSIARSVYASSGADLAPYLERKPYQSRGPAQLVFERGYEPVIARALDSLAPEQLVARDALADSAIAAGRIEQYAVRKHGDGNPLAKRAHELGRDAAAKLMGLAGRGDASSLHFAERIAVTQLLSKDELPALQKCPTDPKLLTADAAVRGLEAEPSPEGGAILDCWTAFVARSTNLLSSAANPGDVARGMLALQARPHRALEAKTLAKTLIERVNPTEQGVITLSTAASRAERSLVYAGLLATSDAKLNQPLLVGWLLVQRDGRGSFGSAAATRAAVEALIAEDQKQQQKVKVVVDFGNAGRQEFELSPETRFVLPVPKDADKVFVKPETGHVLARLERRYLRPFDVTPPTSASGLALDLEWPVAPEAGRVGNLRAELRGGKEGELVEARIPLPPGATLAATTKDVRQIQGMLYVRSQLSTSATLTIPIRFEQAGRVTAREASLLPLDREALPAIARARPLEIRKAK